jgi:holo-[acyl-carrier protein] synthase
MIIGIGTDIADITRIEGLVSRYGTLFVGKIYTPAEITYCSGMAFPAVHFAGRWAAKEAFYKALPSALQPKVTWKSIEILSSQDTKKPALFICSHELKQLLTKEGITSWHVSISHEKKYCVAFVVLESVA